MFDSGSVAHPQMSEKYEAACKDLNNSLSDVLLDLDDAMARFHALQQEFFPHLVSGKVVVDKSRGVFDSIEVLRKTMRETRWKT